MNFIFEGCDNTFKTTTLNAVQKKLVSVGQRTMRINSSGIASVPLTNQYYSDLISIMNSNQDISFLVDRAWTGEEVYGPMYRERDVGEVATLNALLEKELKPKTIIVYLYDSAEHLIQRDDGLSFTVNLDKKKAELKAFEEAVDRSSLHVVKINVDGKSTEDIVKEIFENA